MTSIPRARELAGRAASALGAALVAVLVPKCPLCVAAYLAAFGLGAGAAQIAAPFVRPVALALAGATLLALARGLWRLRKHRAASGCCAPRARIATPI